MDEKKDQFMQAYSISQVSEKLDTHPNTIRQWEKSLEGVLNIPRDEKGARYYTDFEIDALRRVKALREKGVSFDIIREVLASSDTHTSDMVAVTSSLPAMSQSEAIHKHL